MSTRSLAHVRDWVFDLDNTLYPAALTLLGEVEKRMTHFIMRELKLGEAEAAEIRERYFLSHGATVAGLAEHHGVNARDFLEYVHDVATHGLTPDDELNALIAALPGRKIVFTNGGGGHPERVLERLGLAGAFDAIFDIEAASLQAKPNRTAYRQLVARHALDPSCAVLIEDTLRNLPPAHKLGFVTVLVGTVHPEPKPSYLDYWAHDLKAFLQTATGSASTAP
jgi:putative hydrolase of the HAD superfamily